MNFLHYLLRLTENVYDGTLRVWVYAEVSKGYCSAFQDNYIIAEQECHRKLLPFVCERGNKNVVIIKQEGRKGLMMLGGLPWP